MALREIDERASDNIRVTLYWDDDEDTALAPLVVEVEDYATGDELTITEIPVDDRYEAFNHPYTYQKKIDDYARKAPV